MKKGFTLIELLVVVLIIGIIAAIALPSYQASLARTYLAESETLTKAFIEAQQRYFMATGKFTFHEMPTGYHYEKLDIDLPYKDTLDRKEAVVKGNIKMEHGSSGTTKVIWFNRNGIGLKISLQQNGKITTDGCQICCKGNFGSGGCFDANIPNAKACQAAGYTKKPGSATGNCGTGMMTAIWKL